jgi:hypothetical protein
MAADRALIDLPGQFLGLEVDLLQRLSDTVPVAAGPRMFSR